MKRRFADARKNEDIIEKEFKNYYVCNNEFEGNISVLKINKVAKIWCVDEEDRCILNNNYTWLEVYPKEKNYCITVMCDENKNIIEWYFDICKQNGIENEVPFEDDLYLDVVIVPDGRIHILDEDELLEAFKCGDINKYEYDLAYTIKEQILSEYSDVKKLQELTNKYIEKFI